ncbi:MAG: hypothetical protein DRJ99_00600 [Thermoplasmata archaeon]|nr:hypothetical protein [Thermoplasmata archaeon]RLF31079.1 MAG: hypothetical protein DRJ99_00600 [Thermoplasmata archaeon]RLF62195.1 MAG: hypothetical protein DRN16_02200 [Thermoplasmata archaeon]
MRVKKTLILLIVFSLVITPLPLFSGKIVKTEKSHVSNPMVASLPAIVFLRCIWEKGTDAGSGGYTLDIWVIGFGRHRVEIKRFNDFDGDGIWDLKDDSPQVWNINFGLIPIHHLRDLAVSWSSYFGKCHVRIKIWVDGKQLRDRDFTEPWD